MNWHTRIGKEHIFRARFVTIGRGNHMLLRDVIATCETPFRDHIWLPHTARFRRERIRKGDHLRFAGKVNRYYKVVSRNPRRTVVQLSITNIRLLSVERLN